MTVKKRLTEFVAGAFVIGQDWLDPLENIDGPGKITTAENEVFPESTGWTSEIPRAAVNIQEFDSDQDIADATNNAWGRRVDSSALVFHHTDPHI